MEPIYFIDRQTKQKLQEKIYGFWFVYLLYGKFPFSKPINTLFRFLARLPFVSYLYGKMQDSSWSRKKVKPFVKKFQINMLEYEKRVDQFTSFNDFFYRKLKTHARSIPKSNQVAIIPADGRYIFIPNINQHDGFYVKNKKFSLASFLQDEALAKRYDNGTLVLGRLCPTDYHRFHFPCTGMAQKPTLINGYLSAVNLLSLKNNIDVFTENKRMITLLNTEKFGLVTMVEIGAVCVGSIIQTFEPDNLSHKGDEKGYFAFGGSSIALLFEEGRLKLDEELLQTPKYLEIRCEFGQTLGSAP